MATIVGIDLGTTNSVLAVFDETGRPKIVHNSEGGNITPSVVNFRSDDNVEVGEGPRRILFNEENDPRTFGRFKREIGGNKVYEVDGKAYTPTDLSAFVLRKLKIDAEVEVGAIDRAVVTIPANFGKEAREATMKAAELAGLKVEFIVNEPTAAVLYYAFKKGSDLGGTYAIYDLGGGTFDISIIEVSGQDIEVKATEGLGKLGGDDFDEALQKLIMEKYQAETGEALDSEYFTKNDAEDEKKSLSKRDKTLVKVVGPAGRKNIEVTRAEFEEAISTLIAQTEMLCETALDEAGIDASQVRKVFLVGGSTRIPCVVESARRVFEKEPKVAANVDEVVALGAALYAAFRADRQELSEIQQKSVAGVKVQERTSKCFGTIALVDDRIVNAIVIPKQEPIPCSVTQSYYTVSSDQRTVDCSVTESGAPETDPRFVKIIWKGDLELPSGRPASQEIQVTYHYDENQMMRCSFTDVATGQTKEVDLKMASVGDTADVSEVDRFTVE